MNYDYYKWLLLSFKGRITRTPYWIYHTVAFSVLFLVSNPMSDNSETMNLESFIIMLLLTWPTLAVEAKRWHDINKSAWWIMINLIPIIGPIWAAAENGFRDGTRGDNRFGKDPAEGKERDPFISNYKLTKQEVWLALFIGILILLFTAIVIITSIPSKNEYMGF